MSSGAIAGCSLLCFYLHSCWFYIFSVGLLFQLSSSGLFKNISWRIRLYLELVDWHFYIMHHFNEICQLQVGVVATPDIHSFNLTERDKFIILGCDGLWGVISYYLYSFTYLGPVWKLEVWEKLEVWRCESSNIGVWYL